MSNSVNQTDGGLELGLPRWFPKAYGWLVLGVYFLIVLGGSVRVMKAGLACPDWPLCFGKFIPDYQPQVYFEFIHRVVAGTVAIVTVILQTLLFKSRVRKELKFLAAGSLILLSAQVVFGGLTVLLQLQAYVVVTHLFLGTAFFLTLLWVHLSLKQALSGQMGSDGANGPTWLPWFCGFVAAVVYGQVLLGGLVASNFASLVCADFPTCDGQWFPTFSGLIGLQVIHRLGAYSVLAVALTNVFVMRRLGIVRLRKLSFMILMKVCGQVGLGIANVLFFTPPLIAVAHLALGVAILSFAFRQLHFAITGSG